MISAVNVTKEQADRGQSPSRPERHYREEPKLE
jgi:hypothetical protein